MKTINIYLTKDERKKVDIIKAKYQLSLTTITDILCMTTMKAFIDTNNKDAIEKLTNSYLYKNGNKTSIKMPKIMTDRNIFEKEKYKSRFATNVIKIFIYKDIKNYINDEKIISRYYNTTNEKMTKTQDPFWDYNAFIRNQTRMLRENKKYFEGKKQ